MMRNRFIAILVFVSTIGFSHAQEGTIVYNKLKQQYELVVYHSHWGDTYCYGIKQNGFEGCCDKNGRVIVPPTKYTDVSYRPSDNLFYVKIDDKAGVLDEKGKVLIEANKYTKIVWYDHIKQFAVKIGDKAGVLDEKGKVLLEPTIYTSVRWDNDDNLFYVKIDDKAGVLDEKGKVLIEANKYTQIIWHNHNKQFSVEIGDKEGVIDSTGRVLLEPTVYNSVRYDYKDKLFYVQQEDKVGVLDSTGRVLVKPLKGSYINYDKKYRCYTVSQWDSRYKVIARTLYSSKGKVIFESKTMKDMGKVSEGLIAIQENNLWGYMDVTNGKMVIPVQYTSVEPFENGMAKVSKGNESFLISNPLGEGGGGVVSSMTLGEVTHSDIDENVYENPKKQENTFAVVVSVQNYSDFVSLSAANDGRVFRQYCEKTLGIPMSNIIYYEDVTLNTIHNIMARVSDLADAYEGDAKIIFYFAGQGETDDKGNPYLMPSDAVFSMVSTTGYAVEKLYQEFGNLNVQSAIVLLDAGFNNENREGKTVSKNEYVKTKNVPIQGKVVSITAASNGETASLYKEKGHGLFTYFLCKKLKENKGKVNLQDLFDYLQENVSKTARNNGQKSQTPKLVYSSSIILKNVML